MKNISIISIILIVCIVLFACSTTNNNAQLKFYYCTAQLKFGSGDSPVQSENRKEALDRLAYDRIIEQYLEGPISPDLNSPYPDGTSLISITVEQQTANVILNDAFAQLTGIDLTMACTCLSLTVGELTGCVKVQISAQNALLDNKQSITIDTNSISFVDSNT